MRDEMASGEVKSLQVTFVVRDSTRPKRREIEYPQAITECLANIPRKLSICSRDQTMHSIFHAACPTLQRWLRWRTTWSNWGCQGEMISCYERHTSTNLIDLDEDRLLFDHKKNQSKSQPRVWIWASSAGTPPFEDPIPDASARELRSCEYH